MCVCVCVCVCAKCGSVYAHIAQQCQHKVTFTLIVHKDVAVKTEAVLFYDAEVHQFIRRSSQ